MQADYRSHVRRAGRRIFGLRMSLGVSRAMSVGFSVWGCRLGSRRVQESGFRESLQA